MPIAEPSAKPEVAQALKTFRELLNLTPEPSPRLDAAELVEQGGRMADLRETEMTILKLLLRNEPDLLKGNTQCREIRDQLSLRDTQWASALERARREMSRQRQAAQRARQAQRALAER